MRQILSNKNHLFLLSSLVILGISGLFRFYNLVNWTSFGMDQEYQAFIARNIATGVHFPLIGVNASDTGVYLGPLFSYFTALTYFFFQGNPLGWSLLASIWGILTTLTVILIAKKMFSRQVAVFAGIVYGGSFLISFYERQYWNPTPIPFLSLLIGFFLYQFLKHKKHALIHLSFVFAVALQSHLSILVFLPIILYFVIRYRKNIQIKELHISIFILLLSLIPLVVFDIRHQFQNLISINNLLFNSVHSFNFSMIIDKSSQFISMIGRIFWVPFFPDLSLESGQCRELVNFIKSPNIEAIALSLILVVCFIYAYRKIYHREFAFKVILALLIVTVCILLVYNRTVFEYYYLYLFPWIAIIFGLGLTQITKFKHHGSVISTFIVVFFILLNIGTLLTAKKTFSYTEKIQAAQFVKNNLGTQPYSLEAVGGCSIFGGYRYLFDYYHKSPFRSYMDPYFSWLYGQKENASAKSHIVLLSLIDIRNPFLDITTLEEEKLKYLMDYTVLQKAKFNSIDVYILAPKSP